MDPTSDILDEVDRLQRRDRQVRALWLGEHEMASPIDLTAALLDAVGVFERDIVPYMLIGGLAVAVHARSPRATIDVDFAVRSDVDRAALAKRLSEAGFQLKGTHAHTVNLVHRSGAPVQLAFDPAFDAAIGRAQPGTSHGRSFRLVTREDLIALKERAAHDPKRRRSKALRDQADVELLRGDVPDPDEGW
jgi:hypothetical protein